MFKKIPDIEIIEGVRIQDDKILNWLYDNYLQTVKNYVLQNNGSQDDVADVFQDTIIALYNQISDGNLKLTTDLRGYFFGIARNVWNAQLRKKLRNTELDIDPSDEEDNDENGDPLVERVVSRAFQKLRPDQQEILTLFSEGKTYEEISEKMNLKSETYARRKKYMCKEDLLNLVKEDPEYQEYLRLMK